MKRAGTQQLAELSEVITYLRLEMNKGRHDEETLCYREQLRYNWHKGYGLRPYVEVWQRILCAAVCVRDE